MGVPQRRTMDFGLLGTTILPQGAASVRFPHCPPHNLPRTHPFLLIQVAVAMYSGYPPNNTKVEQTMSRWPMPHKHTPQQPPHSHNAQYHPQNHHPHHQPHPSTSSTPSTTSIDNDNNNKQQHIHTPTPSTSSNTHHTTTPSIQTHHTTQQHP